MRACAAIDGPDSGIVIIPTSHGLQREMAMLNAVAEGYDARASLIWSTQQCLVVPRFMAARPRFADVQAVMTARGWPVHIRHTGGDVYPQGPGIANIAIAFRLGRHRSDRISIAYATLCGAIVDALRDCGLTACCEQVEGAFCRGSHDIAIAGRKIAGVAQRWRRVPTTVGSYDAVLVHAGLLYSCDVAAISAAVNEFYRCCGLDRVAEAACHVAPFYQHSAAEAVQLFARIRHRLSRWEVAGSMLDSAADPERRCEWAAAEVLGESRSTVASNSNPPS